MQKITHRIGKGPRAKRRPLRLTLGLLVDRVTSALWGCLTLGAILAPYLALKPATNFWWWP